MGADAKTAMKVEMIDAAVTMPEGEGRTAYGIVSEARCNHRSYKSSLAGAERPGKPDDVAGTQCAPEFGCKISQLRLVVKCPLKRSGEL